MSASMSRTGFGTDYADAATRARPGKGFDDHDYRASGLRRGLIANAIEGQIVPRLMLRRAAPGRPADPPGGPMQVESQQVIDLATFVLDHETEATRAYVQEAAVNHTLESVCFDLLAPAARHLGEMWNEDLCTFTDVTIGLLRLQHALHAITPSAAITHSDGFRRRRILLAPAPGDQHSFGLSMVETFFTRAGWKVVSGVGSTLSDLMSQLRRDWYGVLGLSVGSDVRLDTLGRSLEMLRHASRNRAIGIMVGGPIFVLHPELAAEIGADGTAADGLQATWQAENLLGPRPGAV